MAKLNKHQGDRSRFAKCEICLEVIEIANYFDKGDTIVCYECETEYLLISKSPLKLSIIDDYTEQDTDYGEMMFDD